MEQNEQTLERPKEYIISWDFLEFERPERSKSWYLFFVLAIGVLLGIAVYQVNFLFAVIIIIAAITFIHVSSREPRNLTFVVDKSGVRVSDVYLPYSRIHSFYLIVNEDIKKLFIEPRSIAKPRLAIMLNDDQDPEEIKEILLKYIPENKDREDEPLSELLVRWFKL